LWSLYQKLEKGEAFPQKTNKQDRATKEKRSTTLHQHEGKSATHKKKKQPKKGKKKFKKSKKGSG